MNAPDWLKFYERTMPSANMALVRTRRPILADTGFGGDWPETERLLHDAGVEPENLTLVVNTHFHCDHVGGNHRLQSDYQLPIAAYPVEAEAINGRDAEACDALWLDQPVEPYHVDRLLAEGDEIDAGDVVFEVLHTPGHTPGHVSLYARKYEVLICGDAVHGDDVAWLRPHTAQSHALETAMTSVERLSHLSVRWAYSGHGAAIEEPQVAFAAALRRYEGWLDNPERLAWHACKRIFTYALMLRGGLAENEISDYVLGCPWLHGYAKLSFQLDPNEFVEPLIAEMLRSGAARRQGNRLVAAMPHQPPPVEWLQSVPSPANWPCDG